MEFYSRTNKPSTIAAPECSKMKPTFSLKISKTTGKKELVKTGETNLYDKIQAGKDQTLIYNILERYNKGEIDVLNKTNGAYGDFSNVPTSLAEAQQRIIDAEKAFENLPLEVRMEFNHSSTEFLTSIANGTFEQKVSKFAKKASKTAETEKVEENVETATTANLGGVQ